MNSTSEQALRVALNHEASSIIRLLRAENERLRRELSSTNATLANIQIRSTETEEAQMFRCVYEAGGLSGRARRVLDRAVKKCRISELEKRTPPLGRI